MARILYLPQVRAMYDDRSLIPQERMTKEEQFFDYEAVDQRKLNLQSFRLPSAILTHPPEHLSKCVPSHVTLAYLVTMHAHVCWGILVANLCSKGVDLKCLERASWDELDTVLPQKTTEETIREVSFAHTLQYCSVCFHTLFIASSGVSDEQS